MVGVSFGDLFRGGLLGGAALTLPFPSLLGGAGVGVEALLNYNHPRLPPVPRKNSVFIWFFGAFLGEAFS